MIGPRPAAQGELNYAFRRVLYDMMVAAKSLSSLTQIKGDYSQKESMKIAALIMARNLNDFFFMYQYHHNDDINIKDFGLTSWKPDNTARIGPKDKKRIDKIAGHIVASKPEPFRDGHEVKEIVLPLIKQSHQFVSSCLQERKAEYTGNASQYRRRLDGILPKLGLSKLPRN
jgi:hypothetical protein